MKKFILWFYTILFLVNYSLAQNLKLTSVDNVDLTNDTLIVSSESTSETIYGYVHVENTGDVAMDVIVKKVINSVADSSVSNTFCWGVNCYPPSTTMSNPNSLEPGVVDETFYSEYYPNGIAGQSTITYIFYNERDATDSAFVVITFKAGTVNTEHVLRNIKYAFSKPYPNPANGFTRFDYSIENQENIKLEIYNILGKKVEKYDVVNSGKMLLVNTSELEPGIYFYSFSMYNKVLDTGKLKVIK